MMKWNSYRWIGALALFLVGCGGSSSSDEPGSGSLFPINNDGPVTMPDGTVVDRPNVEDIHPDAVPIEMEQEYANYVWDTAHLRDPRGNVYEIISVNTQGVEERSYLIITPDPHSYSRLDGWALGVAYVLKEQGECYARATSGVSNATLYGRSVFYNGQDEANGGAGAYRLKLDLLDMDWEVSWQLGEYGLIDRIVLLDDEGQIIANASHKDDEHLEHHWVDRGEEVSVLLPFEPLNWTKDAEYDPALFLERACELPPYSGEASDYRMMIQDKAVWEDVVYELADDDDVVHFHFSRVDSDEWDALMQGNDREGEASLIALQMFTQGHDEYSEEPCIQEPGKRAVVYFNSHRFDGLYAQWYEALDGDDRERRMQEGLTFDEDGYLIKSSSGLFTPTSHTDVSWFRECMNYDVDFD